MINDTHLEDVVIGGILLEPKSFNLLCVEDVTTYDNVSTFNTIKEMLEKKESVDVVTVASKLKEKGLDIPINKLFEKVNTLPSTSLLSSDYIPKLKKVTHKRQLLNLLENKREQIYVSDKDVNMICYELLSDVKTIGLRAYEAEWNMTGKLQSILESLERQSKEGDNKKLYFDLNRLDYILAGLHNSELTILGARPGIGKSAFAFQTATTLARKGNNVLFFSLEMADRELLKRLLASTSGINSARIRLPHTLTPEDFSKLVSAGSEISSLPITINDKEFQLEDIIRASVKAKEAGKLDVIMIDYLQLIRSKDGDTRDQQLAYITRSLKLLAKELDVPILCLSQLNRKTEETKRPNLDNLRESGAIEQDADNVIFLHINKEVSRTDTYVPIEIIVAKQRNGSIGYVEMFFHAKCFKFVEEIEESPREGTK
jgi:replicative DNA helicase